MANGPAEPTRPGARRQRSAAFLDRVEEYRFLEQHLRSLGEEPTHHVVIWLAGLGGIGKTRFLGEVRSRFAALPDPPTVVWVPAGTRPLAALISVRDAVDVDCHLFDVALATYGVATDVPLPPSELTLSWWTGSESRPFLGLDADDCPITFAVDRFDELAASVVMRRRYDRADFAEIDALRSRPDELLRLLPQLLGQDVARVLTDPSRRRLVFLYDGFGDLDLEDVGGAAWLPRFVRSLAAGIHVISACSKLRSSPGVWGPSLVDRQLGPLPEDECRRMIRRELGDHLPRRVEDRLVDTSSGIPFYLHTAIDVCRAHIRERGAVEAAALPNSSPGMVHRLLAHLNDDERALAVAVAAVQCFDESLHRQLVHDLGLADRDVGIHGFLEWFFVAEVDRSLFRTHDLLTDFVRRGSGMEAEARFALSKAAEHLSRRIERRVGGAEDRMVPLFSALVEAWQKVSNPGEEIVETLVDIGYTLYDAGYWHELSGLPGLDDSDADEASRMVAQYFAALSARRTKGPVVAVNMLEPLKGRAGLLGRHAMSLSIEFAYLQEIAGDYGYARRRFQELDDAITAFDGTRRDHIRTRLYHADMLTMDGHFGEASSLLRNAYSMVGEERAMDWAELARHRGHAHRFAFDFEVAKHEYLSALDIVRDVPSMRGKLRTNVAEAQCWLRPVQGLRDAEEAIELNARLGSRIEIAKAQAALAVAQSGDGQIDAARVSSERALREAEEVGYRAGRCFAHQARVVTEVRAGDTAAALRSYGQLVEEVESLTTYGHLCVVPAWFLGADEEVRRWSRGVDWTGDGDVRARLESLTSRRP